MKKSQNSELNVKHAMVPRERVLTAAADLFCNEGIHSTGVEAIAVRARTTKMALYRHFQSKDTLVVEWLRRVIGDYCAAFDAIKSAHPNNPRAQILGWAIFIADKAAASTYRGCPFINAIAELSDRDHPARKLIAAHKAREWKQLAELCDAAALASPADTASEIMFVLDGAQVATQNMSVSGLDTRLPRIVEAIVLRQSVLVSETARKESNRK